MFCLACQLFFLTGYYFTIYAKQNTLPAGRWNTISDGVTQTSLFHVQQRKQETSARRKPVPGKKDVRKFGLILSVEVESDCLFVISLEQRMDRCQLISVNKTFPLFNGHFGEILSHAVTVSLRADEIKLWLTPSAVCETAPKSLFWTSSCVPRFEYAPRLAS